MRVNDSKKVMVSFLCLCLVFSNVFAQVDPPKIIGPAPVSAALFKFQNYPIDYSTGVPQIDIPLYEVKSGSLRLPISISYHASGRKVYDRDGNIGLGWTLNAGGMVSRTIYGSPDFGTSVGGLQPFPNPFKLFEDLSSPIVDYQYFQKITKYANSNGEIMPGDWLDSEYDIFSYSVNGLSGKFLFKDNAGVKTPVFISDKAYKVIPTVISNELSKITLIDDQGITYEFTASESKASDAYRPKTGWAVSKIISADKTDTISFSYTGISSVPNTTISQRVTLITSFGMTGETYPAGSEQNEYENTNTAYYDVSRISEIKFKNGKIVFNGTTGSLLISDMQVFDDKNRQVKKIEFSKPSYDSYSELGYVVYKLGAVIFKDTLNNETERYSFEYYPLVSSNGQVNVRYCDWWGYYNNSGVASMVPHIASFTYPGYGGHGMTSIGNPSANRNPNLEAIKSGVLKKITYPTGGTSEFTYELNKCSVWTNTNDVKDGPGLRIYQIKTQENNSPPMVKTYKYGTNENGVGTIDILPSTSNMSEVNTYVYIGPYPGGPGPYDPNRGGNYAEATFHSDFIPEAQEIANRPVVYKEVTEYEGTPEENVGKTIYNYNYSPWLLTALATGLAVPNMPKLHISSYDYLNTASLVKRTEYKMIQNSGIISYKKSRELINTYSTQILENVKGLHVRRINIYPQTGSDAIYNYSAEKFATLRNNQPIYAYQNYQVVTGTKLLYSTVETTNFDNQTDLTTTKTFLYNSRRLLSKQTMDKSDGLTTETVIKYPFDYTGNTTLDDMVTANLLNYPVEQTESLINGASTVHLKSIRTNYNNWGSSTARFAPESVDVKTGSGAYETRLRYYSYDSDGNILSLSKELDSKISYIWDHNKELPIAEVINGAENQIAFTSFEGNGSGNWVGIISGNVVNTAGATGDKYYTLTAAGLSLSGLNSAQKYLVTYWSKDGMYTVSGTSETGYPRSARSISRGGSTWTCWEHMVSGTSTISVSGTGGIDELRLAPDGARITSYTYIPLVGQTAVNDPNNRISYFLYDSNGRLEVVQDMNGHYLKTIEYKTLSTQP